MLSTILVAMVGIYLLFDLGLIMLSVKPLILGGNVLGGLIFRQVFFMYFPRSRPYPLLSEIKC